LKLSAWKRKLSTPAWLVCSALRSRRSENERLPTKLIRSTSTMAPSTISKARSTRPSVRSISRGLTRAASRPCAA
jgi:hypothetical protein